MELLDAVDLTGSIDELAERMDGASAIDRIKLSRQILLMKQSEGPREAITAAPSIEEKPTEFESWVSEERLAALQVMLAAMAKRAAKLGMESVTMTQTGEERFMRIVHRGEMRGMGTVFAASWKAIGLNERIPSGWGDTGRIVRHLKIKVSGEVPRLKGWAFVAAIDHLDGGNVVRSAPGGGDVPAKYLKAESICEHCNVKRSRVATFVMRHTSGDTKQIGRTCLQDFTGNASAEGIASLSQQMSEFWEAVGSAESYEDDGEGRAGRPSYVPLKGLLNYGAALVRQLGYVSKTQADEGRGMATASAALSELLSLDPQISIADEDEDMAAKAIEWAASLSDAEAAGDYMNNIRVIARSEAIAFRHAGIAVSIIPAYQRHLAKKIEQESAGESQWQGTIAKREVFKGLKLSRVTASEGAYGVTNIHRFTDASGNIFVWYASNAKLEVGKTFDIKATVKKHDDYKGVKQTVIIRADATEVS